MTEKRELRVDRVLTVAELMAWTRGPTSLPSPSELEGVETVFIRVSVGKDADELERVMNHVRRFMALSGVARVVFEMV